MPKRSNDFQEVVYIIQTHLAEGSRVEESEELIDRITGAKREVDICIHSTIGHHEVIVSVECRDHARRQTVEWVEAMHAKHQRLPTNLLVLASSSGFTKEALTLAEKYGIETVVAGAIPDSFGPEVGRRLDELWLKTVTVTADRVVTTLEAMPGLDEQRVLLPPDALLFSQDGRELGPLRDLVHSLLHERLDLTHAMRDATGEEKFFKVVVPSPEPSPTAPGLFVRKDDEPEPILRRILELEITGPAVVQVAQMPIKHGEIKGTQYAYGTTATDTHDVLFVVTDPVWEPDATEKGKRTIRFKPRK